MKTSRQIIIEYLYRDAGNFKVYGIKTFSNKQNIPLPEIEKTIRACLIDSLYFIPEQWGFDRLSFASFDPSLDHDWHELDRIYEEVVSGDAEEDVVGLVGRNF